MVLFHCMVRHVMVQYGSLLFVFSTGYSYDTWIIPPTLKQVLNCSATANSWTEPVPFWAESHHAVEKRLDKCGPWSQKGNWTSNISNMLLSLFRSSRSFHPVLYWCHQQVLYAGVCLIKTSHSCCPVEKKLTRCVESLFTLDIILFRPCWKR